MKLIVRLILGLALCYVGSPPANAWAGTPHQHTEDYTTDDYKDAANTTARWAKNLGDLRLRPFRMSVIGSYDTPHYSRDVTVSGDYAYVADVSGGVQTIDISDPTSPVHLDEFLASENYQSDILAVGDRLFIADGLNGFRIMDISDPASPQPAKLYNTPQYIRGVNADGNLAFASEASLDINDPSMLYIFDVGDPDTLSLLGSQEVPAWGQYVDIAGDFAFVAATGAPPGCYVYDISDPTTPTLIGEIVTPDYCREVDVVWPYAYLAVGDAGVWIVDVSDPTSPQFVGSYNTDWYGLGILVDGDNCYVADRAGGLVLLDVSDPTNPVLVDQLDLVDEANKVALAGDVLYVADGSGGLQVVKVAQATSPKSVASAQTSSARTLEVQGDLVIVADQGAGVSVVDISSPESPVLRGQTNRGVVNDVDVSGTLAYAADTFNGMVVVDITNPDSLTVVAAYDSVDNGHAVAVAGDFAYLATSSDGLLVLDVTDPAAPSFVSSYPVFNALELAIEDRLLFACAQTDGLFILDVSDENAPSLVGANDTPGWVFDVAVCGNHAYVADGDHGLRVLDITDPATPVDVGDADTPRIAIGVAVTGNYAFVADQDGFAGAIYVFEVSDPTTPTLVDSLPLTGGTDVAVQGGVAFVASGANGVNLVEVFQRDFDEGGNLGRSTNVNPTAFNAVRARLTTTQNPDIEWEITANNADWQSIPPDDGWHPIDSTGADVRWRSTHRYAAPGVNPLCSEATLEWLYDFAAIDSVGDTPGDTGGFMRLHFSRSGHDFDDASPQVTSYDFYRRDLVPPYNWQAVASISATQQDTYVVDVPTHGDSIQTTYYVYTQTDDAQVFFTSPPDSAMSIDNTVAVAFAMVSGGWQRGGVTLAWEVSTSAAESRFDVYRSREQAAGYVRINASVLAGDATRFTDDSIERGATYYYRIEATDRDGTFLSPVIRVDVPAAGFTLRQNHPNPFNPSTTIAYEVPQTSRVVINIYDVAGRLVRSLVDRRQPAGAYDIEWDGKNDRGADAGSGIYFYRLRAGGREVTRKMVLIK